jgi:hypothetical protein
MGLPDDLPPGRLVKPTLWVSDKPMADATERWVTAQAAHCRTGWWPLLLPPDINLGSFYGPSTESVDAESFLAERWNSERVQLSVDPEGDDRWGDHLPYDAWPGLAPPSAGRDSDSDAVAVSTITRPELEHGHVSDPFSHLELDPDAPGPSPFVDARGRARLGLVETPDSAGAIAASGWEHELGGGPECTAVLRSWQERFGVRLVALGYDWLAVTVAWPVPTNAIDQARRIAAEHVAFCSEILGEVEFEEYAKALIATTVWLFWWD